MEQKESTQILVDNQATISIANDPVFCDKTKNLKMKLYFLREEQREGEIQLIHCKTKYQNVDILTKAFPKSRYEFLRQRLRVCNSITKENVKNGGSNCQIWRLQLSKMEASNMEASNCQ